MSFERRLGLLGWIVLVFLALFSLRLVYWQLVRGFDLQPVAINPLRAAAEYAARGEPTGQPGVDPFQNLASLPQPVLQRTIALLDDITRGGIYDRNGRLLASDQVDEQGNRFRVYHDPSAAHVIGYTSALRTGLTGLEYSYNEALLGTNRLDAQFALALHQQITGSDLILTIDQDLQQQAAAVLAGRAGAVVALDGESGAVLALASAPAFDPNRVLEEGYAEGLLHNCDGSAKCTAHFVNRASQAIFSPGSTFKTVTLIAALDTGLVNPQTVIEFGEPLIDPEGRPYYIYTIDGGVIPDPNHTEDRLGLPMAFARSANAAFARFGVEMGAETFIEYGQRFGFSPPPGREYPLEIEFMPSQLANNVDDLRSNNLLRAATAIGQGELLATPLNIAMMVQAVVNDGDMALPYLVQAIRAPDGTLNERLGNRREYRNLMKDSTAAQVREIMIGVVIDQAGQRAGVDGLTVGGKTGTAQLGGDAAPHAWFAGFAQNGERTVVIVVFVENGGSGTSLAAPIFSQLAATALK
jgi:penicillin-binding protein A